MVIDTVKNRHFLAIELLYGRQRSSGTQPLRFGIDFGGHVMGCLKRYAAVAAIVLIGFGVAAREASADAFTFSFGGETLAGDTNTGVTTWTVAGVAGGADQLFLEAYYLQLGGGAITLITPEVFRVLSANSLLVGYNTNGSGTCTVGDLSGCEVTITHTLSGSSGWSSSFGFFNLTNFSVYTYSDYDLDGTSLGDQGSYVGTGRFLQSDAQSALIWQINQPLTNFDVYNFNGTNGLTTPLQNRTSASGDVVFATQVANAGSMSIDRAIAPVPEPMSIMLFGSGVAGLAARRRFARKA